MIISNKTLTFAYNFVSLRREILSKTWKQN